MARTSIDSTYALPDSDGVTDPSPVAADTTNGNVFTNDGDIILAVVNGATSAVDVSFPFTARLQTVDGVSLPAKSVSVGASSTLKFRLPVEYYGEQAAVDAGTSDLSFFLIR